MRNNREKWQFYSHPSKPALPPSEVRYWKEAMRRLLKVGIEFEFNLPSQKGSCRGDDIQCPCIKIEEGCWRGCTNTKACANTSCLESCSNHGHDGEKCEPNMCAKCDHYEFKCIGTTCIDFVSVCFACDDFDKNCETCKKKYIPEKDPANIRNVLSNELRPSRNYGKVSETGVVSIAQDGSLLGDKGAEIITVGRRVDYWEFYTMSKKIIDRLIEHGGYLNDRTGSHMHVLTSYYENDGANEMEKPLPQIVLANFHQLCRRYQNALTWITIAMSDPNHMTRWEKFRVSILDFSPVTKSMRSVADEIAKHAANQGAKDKYGFINYRKTRFSGEDIDRFHIEFRQPDSTMCPTYYAALACMHYALVIKAVEISRYGLLKVGDESWLKKAKQMKKIILNGCGEYGDNRLGNTEHLLDNREYFIDESLDLVNQLKNTLMKLGPSYEVLIKLAERPVSMRRIDGDTWEDIEKNLSVEMTTVDQLELRLGKIIDLKLVDDCSNMDEWMKEVQRCLAEGDDLESAEGDILEKEISQADIESFVNGKMREGEMIWSDSTGCMMSV